MSAAIPPPTLVSLTTPITSFYQFLLTFPYLPPSELLTPPATGWLPAERAHLSRLGKTEAVTDLLAHLPYIASRDWHVAHETQPLHYTGPYVRGCFEHGLTPERAQLTPVNERVQDHVVALTCGGRYGRWLLLDVLDGTVYDYSLLGGGQPKVEQEVFDSGMAWSYFPKVPIEEFFESWKAKYLSLEWIPVPNKDGKGGQIWLSGANKEADLEEIRRIYREHGWPGPDFRKDECRTALQEWVRNWGKKLAEDFDQEKRSG